MLNKSMHRIIPLLLLSLTFWGNCLAQAQTKPFPGKVKSVTEVVIENKNGKETERKKSFQAFDEQGNVIEEIEFDDDTKIKSHTTYEYNEQGMKVRETSFLPDGKVDTVTGFVYDHEGNRISKTVMDRNGEVKSKKIYRYEYR